MSSKADLLRKTSGANMADSIGVRIRNGQKPKPASVAPAAPKRWDGVRPSKTTIEIPVEKILRDPLQPREEFDLDSLKRLARSLTARGQLQPIRVRWDEQAGAYRLICGERRLRAAKMAGLATMTAVVMDGEVSAEELLALQLIENCLREDLRPVEQAKAFKGLMASRKISIRQLAEDLDLDHSGVAKTLALLELPPKVQQTVDAGQLAPTTAYELTKIQDPKTQEELGTRAVQEKLTGREVKEEIRSRKEPTASADANGNGRGINPQPTTNGNGRGINPQTPTPPASPATGRGKKPVQTKYQPIMREWSTPSGSVVSASVLLAPDHTEKQLWAELIGALEFAQELAYRKQADNLDG